MSFVDNDRAVLLGAVFGDGYIQKRCQKYKTVVTSGNQYTSWFERIDDLFEVVFGRRPHRYEKKPAIDESDETRAARAAGYKFYEKYLTLTADELLSQLGITSKYVEGHEFGSPDPRFVSVPAWVEADDNAIRSFLIGLSETDGWFTYARDRRSPIWEWARFGIAQKDEGLARWAYLALRRNGFEATMHRSEAAGTWHVVVSEQSHVKRLGEWFGSSAKYAALLSSGAGPRAALVSRKTGKPLEAKPARFWPNVPMRRQELWRELRETGMSLSKIASAFRVSKNTIWFSTRDVIPAARMPPSEADRVLVSYADRIREAQEAR